jgi:Ribbon-helix-helix protein, copG family
MRRLQVWMDDDEMAEIQRLAKRSHQTTAAWVREALRVARDTNRRTGIERKLDAINRASTYSHPAPDIEQMLDEIERGYIEPLPE